MPYEVAIPAIETAIRAVLVADSPLTALLATKPTARGGGPAIYNDGEVPGNAAFPYLTMGAWTQIGSHSLSPDSGSGSPQTSGYGWNCTGQLKAVGQASETSLYAIMSAVFRLLPQGQSLSVAGYSTAWTDEFNLQPSFKSTLANVVTYEVPAILRVYCHDS